MDLGEGLAKIHDVSQHLCAGPRRTMLCRGLGPAEMMADAPVHQGCQPPQRAVLVATGFGERQSERRHRRLQAMREIGDVAAGARQPFGVLVEQRGHLGHATGLTSSGCSAGTRSSRPAATAAKIGAQTPQRP